MPFVYDYSAIVVDAFFHREEGQPKSSLRFFSGTIEVTKELQTDIWKIENWKMENINRTMHSKVKCKLSAV